MDALVYEDSPLGDYFEGNAQPHDHRVSSADEDGLPTTTFAPSGLPSFSDRINSIRRSATSLQLSSASSEQILEQFRYIIVASQLLSDEAPPRTVDNDFPERDKSLLNGAVATAVLSYLVALSLHWLRGKKQILRSATWFEILVFAVAAFCSGAAALLFARRQYAKYVQRSAASSLTRLVNDSHVFDNTAGRALRFVQEVELVSRGYELTTPLPPITRLEDRQVVRRCRNLRSQLVATLHLLITFYVESHNVLQHFIIDQDLQRYHDIYEISLLEYSDAIRLANASSEDDASSLKELRFALRLHAVARKVLLCDLLALRPTNGWRRIKQWRAVQRILREIEEETAARQQTLSTILHQEEWGQSQSPTDDIDSTIKPSHPEDDLSCQSTQLKSSVRRFDDLANGIRALNAKLHVFKEELDSLRASKTDDSVLCATLQKHYETLGTELKFLNTEHERGRNSFVSATHLQPHTPSSLSSPIPTSPTSLGGTTIAEGFGGPEHALRLLTGDRDHDTHSQSNRSSDATLFDEEVFEAVAAPKPRARMSLTPGMTREEKMARLNEERKKRQTMMEQAESTTNMLRELQMVIKHKPRGHARSPSGPQGGAISERVASL